MTPHCHSVKEEVVAVDEQVARLDEELRALDKRREEIEEEKKVLAQQRITALARTAPINAMLPEVFVAIFEEVCSVGDREAVETAFRLTSVSKMWREIMLNTPRAWGKVVIEVEEDSQARPMIRRAQAFLERSKATPITITIDVGCWSKTEDRASMVADILDLIAPHIHRCTRLICKGRDEADAPAFLTRLSPHFGPMLSDFTIESRDSVRLQMPELPYLTRLAIDDVGPSGAWSKNMFSNLKILWIRYIKPIQFEGFLDALSSAKDRLEELRLCRCTLAFDSHGFLYPAPSTIRAYCPSLKKLTVVDMLPGDIDLIFESISAPALEEVHLGLDSARFRYFKFMDSSIATSFPQSTIKRLELEECTVENSELRALLATLQAVGPSLKTLAFTAGEIDMRLYEVLIAEPSILPHLTRLECKRINGDLTGREVLRLVQARAGHGRGVAPLQSLLVEKCRSFEHEMIGQIKQFVRDVQFTPF